MGPITTALLILFTPVAGATSFAPISSLYGDTKIIVVNKDNTLSSKELSSLKLVGDTVLIRAECVEIDESSRKLVAKTCIVKRGFGDAWINDEIVIE